MEIEHSSMEKKPINKGRQKQRGKVTTEIQNNQETINSKVDSYILIITLKVNGMNLCVKRLSL